ncbi:FtsX-like permease family protein [Streptacidiphilus sp. PB12-B1b]|uniref:FtsX-like permease family protein n=1 Tax=Streptacidiphilus sp. PB12-B1b TaxID=2705012 RepID=UPI0015FD47E9|nr:FtsX-like permease family protein [Streptacidiphilus sp. PB12-B1b]QMU75227.1 FtsX-like permease family protein [Streptacidiphilus sp. PB12-B1b]
MKLAAWRVALRVARRDALRAKGRSALVIAMIAIPIVGVSAADVTYRSSQLTVQQKITRAMGTAEALITPTQLGWRLEQTPDPGNGQTDVPSEDGSKPHPTAQEQARAAEPVSRLLAQALPAGARLLPISNGTLLSTSTATGVLQVQAQGFDSSDPLSHGMVVLDRGSWPTGHDQVAASTAFLEQSGLSVGQTTTPVGTHLPLTITAAVEFPDALNQPQLVLRPDDLTDAVAAQSAGTGASTGSDDSSAASTAGSWLVALPDHTPFTWADVLKADAYGFSVTSRAVLLDPPPHSAVPIYQDPEYQSDSGGGDARTVTLLSTVVGMALLEIVLLAGPAFAVGARRSRRQLGLIAAGGGNRSQIRAVVLGGGVVLGTTGAAVGIVVGALAVALGRGRLEQYAGQRFGSFALNPTDLLGIVLVGLVTGLLAAVVPAVQAARQDVVASLTGRGTIKSPPRWLTGLGVLGIAGGTAVALLGVGTGQGSSSILGGSVVAELGVVACTPFLVGLFGRLSGRLPLGPRLALRDSTRNRSRTAPAVAAVMAAVAGAVAVSVYQSSSEAESRAAYQASGPMGSVALQLQSGDSPARVAAEVAAVQSTIADLGPRGDLYKLVFRNDCDTTSEGPCGNVALQPPAAAHCPPGAGGWGAPDAELPSTCTHALWGNESFAGQSVVVGSAAALPDLLGIHDQAAAQALADGTVLVTDPEYVTDGHITLELQKVSDAANSDSKATTTTVQLPAEVVTGKPAAVTALLSPSAAASAGLRTAALGSVWAPPQVMSSADQQRLNAALGKVAPSYSLSVERGYQSNSSAIAIGLAIAASVVAIGAAAIATGLAAADSQADLATLAAVGAAPRIRRVLSGFQCAVIAAMGALLGSAAGLVPAWALWHYENSPGQGADPTGPVSAPLVMPWTTLAAIVVGLPLLAWLLAAGCTRSRMVLSRRTA